MTSPEFVLQLNEAISKLNLLIMGLDFCGGQICGVTDWNHTGKLIFLKK